MILLDAGKFGPGLPKRCLGPRMKIYALFGSQKYSYEISKKSLNSGPSYAKKFQPNFPRCIYMNTISAKFSTYLHEQNFI